MGGIKIDDDYGTNEKSGYEEHSKCSIVVRCILKFVLIHSKLLVLYILRVTLIPRWNLTN